MVLGQSYARINIQYIYYKMINIFVTLTSNPSTIDDVEIFRSIDSCRHAVWRKINRFASSFHHFLHGVENEHVTSSKPWYYGKKNVRRVSLYFISHDFVCTQSSMFFRAMTYRAYELLTCAHCQMTSASFQSFRLWATGWHHCHILSAAKTNETLTSRTAAWQFFSATLQVRVSTSNSRQNAE